MALRPNKDAKRRRGYPLRLRLSKKLTQIFPRKRRTKFKTFCAGACTWHKILIRLQVWNLFGMDEQIMRAADCRKLAEKPEGVFRQAQAQRLSSAPSPYSAYMAVERYRSPESGSSTTMVFPAFSGRFASSSAAHRAAPEEIPTSTPSSWPIRRPLE